LHPPSFIGADGTIPVSVGFQKNQGGNARCFERLADMTTSENIMLITFRIVGH
jgi:hypothetical protein